MVHLYSGTAAFMNAYIATKTKLRATWPQKDFNPEHSSDLKVAVSSSSSENVDSSTVSSPRFVPPPLAFEEPFSSLKHGVTMETFELDTTNAYRTNSTDSSIAKHELLLQVASQLVL